MADLETVTAIPRLPRRKPDAHKGDFGRVLIIGGSAGMLGAPALAARAALRAGAGLVTMALPRSIQPFAATLAPGATSIAVEDDRAGCLGDAGADLLIQMATVEKRFDVAAVGPGLGRAQPVLRLIEALVRADVPLVVDADALNVLAAAGPAGRLAGRCVITPHPGELSRLLRRPAEEIQAARIDCALEAVCAMTRGQLDGRAVCLLKGAGTVVTDGRRVYVNQTGNPGLATGGSGDVLTGIIAAFLGQGLSTFDAAVAGAYVHGLAGDLGAAELGLVSLIAEDLPGYLPAAIRRWEAG